MMILRCCVGEENNEIALNLLTSVVIRQSTTLLHSLSRHFVSPSLKNISGMLSTAHVSYAITRSLDESTSRSTYRKAATAARQ